MVVSLGVRYPRLVGNENSVICKIFLHACVESQQCRPSITKALALSVAELLDVKQNG
jgi:hypothetical protein